MCRACQHYNSYYTLCNLIAIILLIIVVLFMSILPALRSFIENDISQASTICINRDRWYLNPNNSQFCRAGARQLKERLKLLADLSSSLSKMKIIHWLCYGTLWGAIRRNGLLEYDKDGDICIVNATTPYVTTFLLSIPDIYFTANYTTFHIWRGLAEVELTLFTYSKQPNDVTNEFTVQRLGWNGHYVRRDCIVEAFPVRFIELPLPYASLDGHLFPVPREHYEIQMYMYPYDWHIIQKPLGCT